MNRVGWRLVAALMAGMPAGAALAADPPPAAASDPLAHLAADVSVVFDVASTQPRLMLIETDHEVASTRVLNVGDEYRDGWLFQSVSGLVVTLKKGAQTRTVTLTGHTQIAASASPTAATPPLKAGEAKLTPDGATAKSPVQYATLAEAVEARNISEIMRLGGSAQDIAKAVMAAGARPGGGPIDPASATFVQRVNGETGIAMVSVTGGTYLVFGADYNGYLPPGGIGSLPTGPEATSPRDGQTFKASTMQPAPTLEAAIAAGNIGQVFRMGGTAEQAAQAFVNVGGQAAGGPVDPSTAVLVRTTATPSYLGLAMRSTTGGNVVLFTTDIQPPTAPGPLPSPEDVFGLPPAAQLFPLLPNAAPAP